MRCGARTTLPPACYAFMVRYLLYVSGLVIICRTAGSGQDVSLIEKTIQAQRWRQRIVLVYAPAEQQAAFRQQQQWLADEADGMAERDIRIIDVVAERISPADRTYLRTKLDVAANQFGVVLIGKDGGVKLRSDKPVSAQTLFATIDGMPMRRQEMRERSTGKPRAGN